MSAQSIAASFPQFLYGLHDIGGHDRMLSAGRPGWVLDAVDLRSQAGTDYSSLRDAGLGVIVCLNHSTDDRGTLPLSTHYEEFAALCATYAQKSPGARVWVIGSAMNTRAAQPALPSGLREPITPLLYARCFRLCRHAIKTLPGRADDLVIPGAVTPFDIESGDWVQYLVDILNLLKDDQGAPEADGIALSTGTHEYNLVQITSDDWMSAPFEERHNNFRAYRDYLAALPSQFRGLPVLITRASPLCGWRNQNIGWIQRAYQEINDWNSEPTNQPIQALVLHHWRASGETDLASIQDKPEVIDDFRTALASGYRIRWREWKAASSTSPVTKPKPTSQPTSMPSLLQMPLRRSVPGISTIPVISPRGAPAAPVTPTATAAPATPRPRTEPAVTQESIAPQTPTRPDFDAHFLAHDTPVNLVAGQAVTVNLCVKNTGGLAWLQNGKSAVHVGYKWLSNDGKAQNNAQDRRTALPADLAVDEEIALSAQLAAPTVPGAYQLQWDLVAEGTKWFGDSGSQPLVVPVRVVQTALAISGWRVEANRNPRQVGLTLDGDPKSFWDSGCAQATGQWFRLNLGAARVIDGIQVLSPGKGFAAGYSLRISQDGKLWTEISRITSGSASDVLAIFAPTRVQYVQLDLLNATEAHWMISEILVHTAVGWRASASHNNADADCAMDDRIDTAWSSGEKQTPGMWFQLDLGRVEKVSGLKLLALRDEYPIGLRVTVWNAGANRWQIVAERADNRGNPEMVFPLVATQFINLQLVQSADAAWAIQHVRVYREMESWAGPTSRSE